MMHASTRWPRLAGPALLLSLSLGLIAVPAQAAPLTLEFSGSSFFVTDPSDVFATTAGDTYSLLVTYDPALLTGTDVGDFTFYDTSAGETAITFSFQSSGGDSFVGDNSFPIRIGVKNTPDFLVTMNPSDGHDTFTIDGNFDAVTTLSLVLIESLGTNPLSSNNLPTSAFGGGPGTWSVSELDIDRTDLFANISGSVSNIEEVEVPEPSTMLICLLGGLPLWARRRGKIPLRRRAARAAV